MIVIVFLCSKARLKLLRAHTSLLFQTQRRKKNTKNTKIFRVGRWIVSWAIKSTCACLIALLSSAVYNTGQAKNKRILIQVTSRRWKIAKRLHLLQQIRVGQLSCWIPIRSYFNPWIGTRSIEESFEAPNEARPRYLRQSFEARLQQAGLEMKKIHQSPFGD